MSDSENISQSVFAAVCRERDDALALLAQYSAEREHNAMQALAYKAERDEAIATCQELVTDSNAVTLAATVVRLERERNEAREALSGRTVSCSQCNEAAKQLEAMREAIKEAHAAINLQLFVRGTRDDTTQVRIQMEAALAKLKPFIKP
jgi:hypothetical protein